MYNHMCTMTVYHRWLLLFVLKDVLALRNVLLTIIPSTVQKSHDAILRCSYDLDGAGLSYVKWYRGINEFYRYTPSDSLPIKVFPLNGINVDVHRSNDTQVVITDVDFQIAGKFSCEVTTTEEPAKTGTSERSMTVVQLPNSPPTISVGWEPLDYGDILRANCTSPPARPPVTLTFILNNYTAVYSEPRQPTSLRYSDLTLELPLKEYHFNKGKLILRCVAQVPGIYHEEAKLELQSARDPVPEKVRAPSAADHLRTRAIFQSLLFFIVLNSYC